MWQILFSMLKHHSITTMNKNNSVYILEVVDTDDRQKN